ncbi:hypothetical protein PUR29_36440 [Methylobacterium ajmalii]|uniref:Uncharacterized protein n=1 Tax=Methylobacterium ajmalii TaxID=2738439 RepID=A0ABV0A519_9HYPH
MPAARAGLAALIDSQARCAICDAPMGGCGCWTRCSCGWNFRTGEACRNPIHAAEQAADERARAVAGTVAADLARLYPEPMRHASGGFRKTLREMIRREVKAALIEVQSPGDSE